MYAVLKWLDAHNRLHLREIDMRKRTLLVPDPETNCSYYRMELLQNGILLQVAFPYAKFQDLLIIFESIHKANKNLKIYAKICKISIYVYAMRINIDSTF